MIVSKYVVGLVSIVVGVDSVMVIGYLNMAFSLVWRSVQRLLRAIDHSLVWLANPFGVNVKNTKKRYAILLGIYGAIYLVALLPVPVIALIALCIGYVGVLAVGRA